VEQRLKRRINSLEINYIRSTLDKNVTDVRSLSPAAKKNLSAKFADDLQEVLVKQPLDFTNYRNDLIRNTSGEESTTPQQITTNEQTAVGLSAPSRVQWNIDDVDIKENNILFDTKYRNISVNNAYNFILQRATVGAIQYNGQIYLESIPQFITQIEIGTFFIPIVSNNYIDYYGKIYMLFDELASQSINLTGYRRYHFSFTVEVVDNRLKLTPEKPKFNFNPRFNLVEILTFRFLTPDNDFELFTDRDNLASVSYTNPARIVTSVSHGLTSTDIIYIDRFSSANPSINSTMNSSLGLSITKIDAVTFDLNGIDLTPLGAGSQIITVIFGNKRMLIPFTIRSIDPSKT
jgi:hypothetical protein